MSILIFRSRVLSEVVKRQMSMSATLHSDTASAQNTINEAEVNKFRQMAETWWDPNGPATGLHSMNRLRVPFIRDGLIHTGHGHGGVALPLKGLTILDVGCGGGILSERLARLGASVTGIDPVNDNVACAREHARKDQSLDERLTYRNTTVEQLVADEPERKFDAVVASEVIEHVDNPQFFVATCASLLNPGGSFFVTTMSRTTTSWLGAIVAAEYILKLLPAGTHDWNKFINPDELSRFLYTANLRTRLTHGMFYIPGLNKWTWFPDTSVNYAVHAIKKE